MSRDDRSTWSNEPDLPGADGSVPTGDPERYALGTMIGQGGVGEVYAAVDTRLEREVAVKVLSDPTFGGRARFVNEARVTARLEHPNIIPVHDLGATEDGAPYLAMKRVRGRSLGALLQDGAVVSLETRLEIFRKLCDAVAFAHASGVLHRDLKPENVMVGEFGEVLLMDWGSAVALDSETGVEIAPTGGVVGTPSFMAPEQIKGAPGTVRLDVYGLGAVLYELLVGQGAFPSGPDLLGRVERGELILPRKADPTLSAELERVILRAMALRPEDRYPSVATLREDIDAVLAHRPLVHVRSTPGERLAKWMDRHRGPLRAGAAATGLGLVVLLLGSWRYGQELGVARDAAMEAADRARSAELDAVVEAAAAQVALSDALEGQGLALEAETHLRAAEALLKGRDLDRRTLDLAWSQHVADSPPPVATCTPHAGATVRALGLSADGRDAWSWGEDGRLIRWDPVGCLERSATALGEVAGPGALDVGRGIGALIVDGSLVWVDLASGAQRRVPAPAQALAVGLDQGAVWVRDSDYAIWALDAGGTALHRLEAGPVAGSAWRPAGGGRYWLADSTRTGHEPAGVWRAGDTAPLYTVPDFDFVDLSADGGLLLAGDAVGVQVVDVGRGQRWRRDQGAVRGLGLAPDDRVGWVENYDGSVRVYDVETGAVLAAYVGTGDVPTAVAVAPSAHLLGIAGADGRVLVYLRPPFPVRRPPQPLTNIPQGLAISPDGHRLAVGDDDGRLVLVDVATGRTLREWSGWKTGVRQIAFSPDGRRLAAAVRYDGVAVLDPDSGATRTIPLPARTVSVAWTAAGLLTVDVAGMILRLDPDSGAVGWVGPGLKAGSWALEARGEQVLTAGHVGDEHGMLLLSATDGHILRHLPLDVIGFHLAWSPDGRRAAVATSDGQARVFDLADGKVLRVLQADAGPTIGVAWSPDGGLLATTGYARQVKIWDPDSGALLRAIHQHEGPGVNVQFSPDGSRLYSTGSDGYRVLPLRARQEHETDVAALRDGGPGRAAALARLGWWERVEEFAGDNEEDRRLVAEARMVLGAGGH